MNYTLYGSLPSPFVRRIRMLMENIPFEFKEINIYEKPGSDILKNINPINQIPVLVDGEKTIWDSRMIFNYLNEKHHIHSMNWEDENKLTAIDGALNAGVALLLMKRSNIDINQDFMIVKRHKERIESILDYLNPYIEHEAMKQWNFNTMSIYSFLDWGLFREILDISHRPLYQKFMKTHGNRSIVQSTQIPKV
jgi:glutathione S-transferase